MLINVSKITDANLMHWACSMTGGISISLDNIYQAEHSSMRAQLFKIELLNVPAFISGHLVRHTSSGQLHFVEPGRYDRVRVKHGMILNAQHLVNMSRKELCYKADMEVLHWMTGIRLEVAKIDATLAKYMVAECVYRGGVCSEHDPCGVRDL